MNNSVFPIVCTTLKGLEPILAKELTALGADQITIGRRMVECVGDQTLLYKANIHLRTAMRVLKPIFTCKATTSDELFEKLKVLKWDEYIAPNKSFLIDSVVNSESMRHSMYVTYRTKDSLMDYFQEHHGRRMRVSTENPDVTFNIHVSHEQCTLSLDSSGTPLYRRGYRIEQTEAPINEVLAAGIIQMSGWDGSTPLLDPMCGSGTFLIEAALIGLGIPPGIFRKGFAFQHWLDYNEELFDDLLHDDSNDRELTQPIFGSDVSIGAVTIAQRNIDRAGLTKYITLQHKRFEAYEEAPAEKGMIITNPPYGERLRPDDLMELYDRLGERLKHGFNGWTAWIISAVGEHWFKIGLRPDARIELLNASLDCELRRYELFDGKRKAWKEESSDDKECNGNEMTAGDNAPQRERRFEKPRFEKPRFERSGERRFDRPRNGGFDKPRGDRFDRSDRSNGFDRPRGDRFDRSDRSNGFDRPRGDRFDRPTRYKGAGDGGYENHSRENRFNDRSRDRNSNFTPRNDERRFDKPRDKGQRIEPSRDNERSFDRPRFDRQWEDRRAPKPNRPRTITPKEENEE